MINIVNILKLISYSLMKNKNVVFKAILGLAVASLTTCSIILYKNNKKLSESLKMANNNIEVYQNIANGFMEQNNELMLTVDQLNNSKDSLLTALKNNANKNNIKIKDISTAATQTQSIYVSNNKGVGGYLVDILKAGETYSDSINFNTLTTVYYDISNDSVNIGLDIQNTQYLYTFKHKEYKNKKNFLQRLFTFDFKKIYKYEYKIENTNDLIHTDDVRVIEIIK